MDKMIEILKNAKLNDNGIKLLYNDFTTLTKLSCEYMYETFYNQINYIKYLVEMFNIPKEGVDTFVEGLMCEEKFKYDGELLKILVKKRKGLKN